MPTQERRRPKAAKDEGVTRGFFSENNGRPMKLLASIATREQFDGSEGPLRWYLEFERPDRKFPDGNQALDRYWLFLERKDGTPVGRGSQADQVAQSFEEACGCSLMPGDPDTEDFINHWFRVRAEKVPDTEKIYIPAVKEYMGEDFEYTGPVTTIGEENGDAPAEAAVDEEDESNARYLANLLNGMEESEIRGGSVLEMIKGDETLKGVQTILGKSLRGGFVKPKAVLLDKLIDEGYVTVDEGVVQTTEES